MILIVYEAGWLGVNKQVGQRAIQRATISNAAIIKRIDKPLQPESKKTKAFPKAFGEEIQGTVVSLLRITFWMTVC